MSKRRGFTLVELLVVIGIIAILISILIPALGRAKQQANMVKCQTQLREIFNCFKLYEAEYRGFWPVARVNGIRISGTLKPYNLDGYDFLAPAPASSRNQGYFFNFLAKYATRGKMGNAGNLDIVAADESRKTIFFGCPNWQGYYKDATATVGDTNIIQPGYGMNIFPTFRPNYPSTNYPPQLPANRPKEVAVLDPQNESPTGNFLKATAWTMSSQRMLLSESRFWLAQSPPVAARASYPPAVVPQRQISNDAAGSPSGEQTYLDIYRHGKTPQLQGNTFDPNGGKIAYNVLYSDGHVATATGGQEAYRSIRMKFPG